MSESIQSLIDDIIAGRQHLILNIDDENGQFIGQMKPLTYEHLDQPHVLQKITDWRNENMSNFLTQFVATLDRTRNWLENIVFKTQGQLLFLVFDNNGDIVGHFGFKNLSAQDVLLDNAIRGVRSGHPKIFSYAGKAIVEWLFDNTMINRVYGEVFSDNVAAIMMNKQIGFVTSARHPLLKRVTNNETHWDIGQEGADSPSNRYCYKLVIDRSDRL